MIGLRRRERNIRDLRASWASFLGRYEWQCFLTLTFDQKRYSLKFESDPEQADKAFRTLVRFVNERLYGPRWMSKSASKGAIWARVQEAHDDGYLHFHALLHTPNHQPRGAFYSDLAKWWDRRFGMARIEVVQSPDAVIGYIVKHLGNLEMAEPAFSRNLGMPPLS